MKQDLEQVRDAWLDAFYQGDVLALQRYEHAQLKVIYEDKARTESSLNRYEQIAHAVQNAVWKPQKPAIVAEEFEFDEQSQQCTVYLKSDANRVIMQEIWRLDHTWMLLELRFCQVKR